MFTLQLQFSEGAKKNIYFQFIQFMFLVFVLFFF